MQVEASNSSLLEWSAIGTALVSIWIAWSEAWRNNRVVLRLLVFRASHVYTIERPAGPFQQLEIVLRNHGVPLHNVVIELAFQVPREHGTMYMRLHPRGPQLRSTGELGKGMVLMGKVKSYEYAEHDRSILLMLDHPDTKRIYLNIYSQDFLVHRRRVGGSADHLKSAWNWIAWRVNYWFRWKVGVNAEGMDVVRRWEPLPTFIVVGRELREFCRGVREGEERAAPQVSQRQASPRD